MHTVIPKAEALSLFNLDPDGKQWHVIFFLPVKINEAVVSISVKAFDSEQDAWQACNYLNGGSANLPECLDAWIL